MKHLSLFNLDTACFPGGSTIDHWTVKKQAAWKREGFLFKGRISLFGELLSSDKSVKVRQNNSRYLQQKCIKLTKIFTKQRKQMLQMRLFFTKNVKVSRCGREVVMIDDQIFFAEWLTNKMCLILFPSETIMRGSHHRERTSDYYCYWFISIWLMAYST